ncbi:MAG: hypothetical protein H6815_10065 [Phycisphaeraceae bacterium]|nr:hypothetical protein [Phycisphaerales bacterium]MCB9860783.1 hypothetical protein [Phycisphaeraceae bacterium]
MRSINLDTPVPTRFAIAGIVAIAVIVMQIVLVLGRSTDPAMSSLFVGSSWVRSGWPVVLYVLAGAGFGTYITGKLKLADTHWTISCAVGLGLLLFLTTTLGTFGLLVGSLGRIVAWLVVLLGAGLFAPTTFAFFRKKPSKHTSLGTWIPLCAIVCCSLPVLIAATSPPGYLWTSEFGGFDALSYHLELPKRWLNAAHIAAFPDNIYSFFPSWIESSYVHLAMLAGDVSRDTHGIDRFIAGDARSLIGAQLFTAATCVICACMVGHMVHAACRHLNFKPHTAPAIASCVFLLTPWSIVIGSLAYNECGMMLFGVASWVIAMQRGTQSSAKAVCIAILLGASFGCKPTAAFMFAPVTIAIALATSPRKHWIASGAIVVLLGVVTPTPWIVRNLRVSSNPLMPFATSVFGTGHWTQEQADRFSKAHHNSEPIGERLAILVGPQSITPTSSQPDTRSAVEKHRGYSNPQWLPVPLFALIGLGAGLTSRWTRKITIIAGGALALQLLAWMSVTHLQSRFLLPTLPLLCSFAVVPIAVLARAQKAQFTRLLSAVIVIVTAVVSVMFLATERNGQAFQLAGTPPSAWNGNALRDITQNTNISPADRAAALAQSPASAWINTIAPQDADVLVLGDAATLYVRSPYTMATTWDSSAIDAILQRHNESAINWHAELAVAGFDIVVINFAELARYRESNWNIPSLTEERVNEIGQQLSPPAWVHESGNIAAFIVQPSRSTPPE